MKKDFIPRSNSDLYSFIKNFIEQFEKNASRLSLKDSDISEVNRVLKKHLRSYSEMISLRARSRAATETYNNDKKQSSDLIRRLSKQIKSDVKYKTAIGEGFGIINNYTPVKDFSDLSPVLKTTVSGFEVKIKYKKNNALGITLYSRRGNENKFSVLATTLSTTYIDKRAKLSGSDPESREYYAYYIVKDNTAGKRSNITRAVIP